MKYSYDNSDYIIIFPSEYGEKEIVPKDCYEPGLMCKFEDIQVSVPVNADAILKKLYGDYMKLPLVEKRCSKHDIAILTK